jgi:hypothetical protein
MATVCDPHTEGILVSLNQSRMGQNIYPTDCETDNLSGDRSDICRQSSVYVAILQFWGYILMPYRLES